MQDVGQGRRRLAADGGQVYELEAEPEARGRRQHLPDLAPERPDPRGQQRRHVVGDLEPADGGGVPPPAPRRLVEGQEPPLLEAPQQLADEVRVAACLGAHQGGELRRRGRLRPEAVGDEPVDDGGRKLGQRDLGDPGPAAARRLGARPQGLDRAVLVAARPDHQHALQARRRPQPAEEPQRGVVRPLEVVQEHHQRRVQPGHGPHEPGEQEVEPVPGLEIAERRDLRLGADDQLEPRDHLDQGAAVPAQRLEQDAPRLREGILALAQEVVHQPLEGPEPAPVRNGVLALVELPLQETAAPRGEWAAQVVHERGLARAATS